MEDDAEEMSMLRQMRNKNYRGRNKTQESSDDEDSVNEPTSSNPTLNEDMYSKMGFTGFGKKARSFDFQSMFEQTKKAAQEKFVDKPKLGRTASVETASKEQHVNSGVLKHSDPKSNKNNKDSSSSSEEDSSDSEDEFVGPPVPQNIKDALNKEHPKSDIEEESESEEESTDINVRYKVIPSSNAIKLQHGSKTVSAIALDPNGARLVTGGYDFDVKFWDFVGMDTSVQSFRSLRPCESHQIQNICYSATGDSILVVAGNAQAKVLDRDGLEQFECPKGDQYISDMSKTKGHCAMLNDGCWHPRIKEEFITCSNDGSLRIWMIDEKTVQKHVIKPRQMGGLRALPTSCRFNRDGQLVAAACQDGSIQMWDHRKNFVSTTFLVRGAHDRGTDISSIAFSYDNTYLASRGGDETLKLWDLRKFKDPIHSASNLFNRYPMTDCCFSPDDGYVFTGVSLLRNEKVGKIVFFDRNSFNKVHELEAGDSDIVRTMWHPKLNQIIASSKSGAVKVFFDPNLSSRGAKLCVTKTKKRSKEVEMICEQQIITPHALPMFRVDRPRSSKKQLEKDRKDPLKSRRPDLPVTGPGQGGRIASAGNTLSSFIVRNLGLKKKVDDTLNPRDAILKYAKEAEENPYWVTPAYSKTQPKPVFSTVEKTEEPPKKQAKLDKL